MNDMDDNNYRELVDFIGERFDSVDKRFYADTYFMEMAALGNKLDRHERWINMIAEKLGLKLPS